VNVVQVTINVHRGPGKSDHTRSQLVFEILKVRNEETLGVGANLVNNAVVFLEHKLEFVVVHLELVFLKKDDLGTLRNVNTDTGKAFGLTDKGEDFAIEVNVEFVVLRVSNDKSSLKTSLGLLDFTRPLGTPEELIQEQSVTNVVVMLDLGFLTRGLNELRRELPHGN